jgi:hypothetical protein
MKNIDQTRFISHGGAKLAKFGEIGRSFSLRAGRPFGSAQDMLGAIKFLTSFYSRFRR